MRKDFYIFLLIVYSLIEISSCELKRVLIKSHKIITKGFTINNVNSIYDNNTSTKGSFYSMEKNNVQVDFDLGKNYVIEKMVVTLESELKELSFLVGNLVKGEGGLLFICTIKASTAFECVPKCRKEDPSRNGILARKLQMIFLVKGWSSIYELEVYANTKQKNQNLISSNRYIYPDECSTKSWLLTSVNKEFQPIPQEKGAKIFLEKHYVITELDVEFKENIPENLEIQLSNGEKKVIDVVINLEKCKTRKSKYSCSLNRGQFPTRVFVLLNSNVVHISLRGKPVFYPTLKIETSTNLKENLYVTCKINKCDRSVHSDCSETSMTSGIQFQCNNKRLIRVPSGSELDSFVIVNQGQVEKSWSDTKFTVKSNEYDKLIVSIPRNYQYFGQYQCSCLMADEPSTDIKSQITSLAETDFLENLIFKISVQYKLDENEETFNDSYDNNLLIIRNKDLKNSFITVKVAAFSLVKNIIMDIIYPKDNVETESLMVESSTPTTIKAFTKNPQSWNVKVYKYQVDEIYPEFIHQKDITLKFSLKKYNLNQKNVIRFIKISDETNNKPEMSKTVSKKLISIKAVYTEFNALKLNVAKETCSKTSTQSLAIFGKNICEKFDLKVKCSNHSGGAIISIDENRNVATNYKYYVVDVTNNQTLSEIFVERSVISFEKDLKIQVRYASINGDPSGKGIATLDVELKFISKVIEDFIPCGKVSLKITEKNKNAKQLVLQIPTYKFTVDLNKSFFNFEIKIEIDGMVTNSTRSIKIINPETFSVKDLEIRGKSKLKVHWVGIDQIASDILVGYEVKTVTETVSCQLRQEKSRFKNVSNSNKYEMDLDSINNKIHTKLYVSVLPVYKNNKFGNISRIEREFKFTGRTRVILDQNILPRGKFFTLVPFQSNLLCDIGNVDFQITSSELEIVPKNISKVKEMKYEIKNLVPGRNYKLTAQVHYWSGEPDQISEPITFNTSYEISIAQERHVAQVGDKVNITCEADVGPDDKFRKILEWRRADFSELPDGVVSIYDSSKPNLAFLVMEKSLADFSGDYSCVVKSKAGQGSSQISIIVNDLVVNPDVFKVNFNQILTPISTKCHSSTIGDGKLIWTDSNNKEIDQTENEKYKIVNKITKKELVESTLIIKSPSLDTSGVYNCHKSIGEFKASKMFKLFGEEKLEIIPLTNSSSFVGEKTRLRCKGQLGMKNQKVVWEIKGLMDSNNNNLIKKSYNDPTNLSIQDIEIINNLALHKISCILLPSLNDTSRPIEKSYNIKLFPKIEIDGPQLISAGSSVNLTCMGYPTRKSMIIQWVFYEKKTNSSSNSGLVLLTSENQSSPNSHEPITLVLSLKNVQDNGTGYYECQFRSQMRSENFSGKSLRLSVNPNPRALGSEIRQLGKGSNLKAMSLTFIYLLTILCTVLFYL